MTDSVPPDQARMLERVLEQAVWARQAALASYLFAYYQGRVAAGPFQGLLLCPDVSWGMGDNAAKLTGLYEAELQPALRDLAATTPSAVVNVGCAEGYYAVGLARLLPQAVIYAFDSDPKAQVICRETATLNQVTDRVMVLGTCTPPVLLSLLRQHPAALLVIDCEGYEKELLADAVLAAAAHASLIVECHDFVDPTITPTLIERLRASHTVENVIEGARDPNRLEPLQKMSSLDRWLVALENRPAMMNWIVARPRG
jgi:precorrin-6B methylase 2